MFTGLVEALGKVESVDKQNQTIRLNISLSQLPNGQVRVGDSISVNGCCLTISSLEGDVGFFDVMETTYQVTSLKNLKKNDHVNLERAMASDGRFGGHLMSGHVDTTATIFDVEKNEMSHLFTFTIGESFLSDFVDKGSVAVDGVSLTVNSLDQTMSQFSVSIIPHTYEQTLFKRYSIGDLVNIELDMISKYVRSHVERILKKEQLEE